MNEFEIDEKIGRDKLQKVIDYVNRINKRENYADNLQLTFNDEIYGTNDAGMLNVSKDLLSIVEIKNRNFNSNTYYSDIIEVTKYKKLHELKDYIMSQEFYFNVQILYINFYTDDIMRVYKIDNMNPLKYQVEDRECNITTADKTSCKAFKKVMMIACNYAIKELNLTKILK